MRPTLLPILLIITNVAGQETASISTEATPQSRNAFKFEGQSDAQSYGLIKFEDENNVQDHQNILDFKGQRIKFEEENRIENQRPNHLKKKRRRRKPKQIPNAVPGVPNGGFFGYPQPGPLYPGPVYPGQRYPSVYPGHYHKPRPSPTESALTAVTEALTSIALYDDRQCVPRLLCEAAGGAGVGAASTTGVGGLLQAVSGLQPLLTLLAAYNGVSSSPLFIFGRAVFLGMTSKANPGTCHYAYPDCPKDPEQLVHYLNNHNGGFFRFFAAPQLNQQQGLEQFYNQLSGQNYGYYQPQQGLQQVGYEQQQNYQGQNLQQPGQQQLNYPGQNLQEFGYGQQQQYLVQNQRPGFGQYPLQPGLYQNQYQGYQHQNLHQGHSQQYNNHNFQNPGSQRPGLYGNSYGFYGKGYPYQKSLNHSQFKSNKIEKRIQNTPTAFINGNVGGNSKWLFPESPVGNSNKQTFNNVRGGKVLKFPQKDVGFTADGFVFPGIQSNRDYGANNIEALEANDFDYVPDPLDKFRVEKQYNNGVNGNYWSNGGVTTLYIVRGNGDPNHPEIVHLAPGQTL